MRIETLSNERAVWISEVFGELCKKIVLAGEQVK